MSEKVYLRNVSGGNYIIPEIQSKPIISDPHKVWEVDRKIVDGSYMIQGLINSGKFIFSKEDYKNRDEEKPVEIPVKQETRDRRYVKEENSVDSHLQPKDKKIQQEKTVETIDPVFSFGDVNEIIETKQAETNNTLRSQIETSKKTDNSKKNVWWRGPANDMGGYGKMNRYCLEGLAKKDLHIHLDMHNIPSIRNTITLSKELEQMTENKVDMNAPSVWAIMPPKFPTRQGKIIYFTMLESGRAHPSFVKKLNNADEIWVPSLFNIDILKEENLDAEIHHVPLGVDTTLYRALDLTPLQKKKFNVQTKGFVFLSVFGWSLRKGTDVLLKSYLKTFSKFDDTTLLIVSRLNGSSSMENIKRIRDEISEHIRTFCPNPSEHPHIVHIGVGIPEKEMPILYNMCDCFVLPSRGEGWCTLPEAKIKTPNGIKEIKDIKEGDSIFTHRGLESKVVKTFKKKYNDEMVRVKCYGRNNQFLTLTPNHKVRAIRTSDLSSKTTSKFIKNCIYDIENDCLIHGHENSNHYKNKYTKYNLEWIPSGELKKGDLIFYPSIKYSEKLEKIKLNEINSIKNRNEVRNDKIYKTGCNQFGEFKSNEVLFNDINIEINEDLMRLFGYYVAEGNSMVDGTICFSFSLNEKEYHDDVEFLMSKLFSLNRKKDQLKDGKESIVLRFGSVVMSDLFLHLFGHKARNKKIPNWFFNLNKKLINEFLKGLFRGDGSFGGPKLDSYGDCNKVSFSTSSINLANQIFDLLQQQGISSVIKSRVINNEKSNGFDKEYYSVQITNIKDHNSLMFIFGEFSKELESKKHYEVFKTSKDFQLLKIREIEMINYDGYVYNFGVEGDNSYICDNYAVHNCLPAIEAGACGLPVIMTRCGGQLDFLNDDNSYLIDIEGYGMEKQEIKDISSYYEDVPFAVLGNTAITQLCEAMKEVYVNKRESRQKGEMLMQHIRENFTWKNSVEKIYERLTRQQPLP